MILNSIWWRGSSSGDLGNVEYLSDAIIPRSTQTQRGSCLWVKWIFLEIVSIGLEYLKTQLVANKSLLNRNSSPCKEIH